MERKNGDGRIQKIHVLAGKIGERIRLGLRSPWVVLPVFTFVFARQPDSQAEEYKWNDGAALWSTDAQSWTLEGLPSAWPELNRNADALFMTGDEAITLGSDVLVNDIELAPEAGNVTVSGTHTLVLAGEVYTTIEIAAGRSLTVNSNVIADAGFTKTGSGTLTLSSNTSRLADVTVNDGLLQIGTSASTGGNLALRRSDVAVASGATVLSVGNTGSATNFNLWTGNLSGAGTISTKSATITTTGALNISLTGDSQFTGTVTASGLNVQGTGTQQFSGNVASVTGAAKITTGATLKLSGTGANGSLGSSQYSLLGGAIVLDNTFTSIGRIEGPITSRGGKLHIIGNQSGTIEGIGSLNVAGGHTRIEIEPGSVNATTWLTFDNLISSAGGTVDFDFHGHTPAADSALRITLKSSGTDLLPFATINGRSFAKYSGTTATGSLIEAPTTPLTTVGGASVDAFLDGTFTVNAPPAAFALNSLTIAPSGAGQYLDITGSGNLRVTAFLLRGENKEFEIRHSGTGGISGTVPRIFHVPSATSSLTVGASLYTTSSLAGVIKAGSGLLNLTANNSALLHPLTINDGTVRSRPAQLPGGTLKLRGGVFEIANGGDAAGGLVDFTRSLGTGNGNINWSDGTDVGEGGFSAFGGHATINLGGLATPSTLIWNTGGFVPDGGALVFGSARADSRITFLNNIALDAGSSSSTYNLRTFRVADNSTSTTDVARLAGNVSGSANSDFLKTGAGRLEVTGNNTYTGQTIIHSGELQIGANEGTGAGNGRLSGTDRIVVNQSGSLLLGGQNSFTDRISDSTAVTLDGGEIVTGGFSEYSGSSGAIQPGIGALTLLSDSLIDFGGGASIFAFSNSSHTTWTGSLQIHNFGQGDRLFFGTSSSGLNPAQLSMITFYADSGLTRLGSAAINFDGELSVVPEPSTGLTAAALMVFLGSRHRIRSRRRRDC